MVRRTRILRVQLWAWLLLGALSSAPVAWAEDAKPAAAEERRAATKAAAKAHKEAVIARIGESAAFLAAQQRYSFRARTSYDVMQITDQMLEFGAVQTATVRRPDRMRVESVDRSGERRSMTFDGKTIAVDLPDSDAYVSIEKPGSLEAAVEYLVGDLDTPAPLHEFLTSNYFDQAAKQVRSGFFVETEQIGDQICDHLAFRGANVDVQLWLRIGDEPLPCRMVITYADQAGAPQFTAEFDEWNLTPEVSDSLFEFVPPDGAERLTLHAAQREIAEEDSKP